MRATSIRFIENSTSLTGVVTHIVHSARDNRGVSSIFQLKIAEQKIVVVAEFETINSIPSIGEIWCVTGEHQSDLTYGSQFKVGKGEKQHPTESTSLDVLVDFLVFNSVFVGISRHWAKKLAKTFNTNLYAVLDSISAHELAKHKELKISKTMAARLLEGWELVKRQSVLNDFFEEKDLPEELIETTRQVLGECAVEHIGQNPYLLYPIMSVKSPNRNWRELDKIIRKQFNIKKSDSRRAVSFVESVLYSAFNQHGHMALPVSDVEDVLTEACIEFDLSGLNNGSLAYRTLCFNEGTQTIQILGHQAIEVTINALLDKRIKESVSNIKLSSEDIESTLSKLTAVDIELNVGQKRAFENALTKPLSIIEGCTKTGKSLIVSSVVDALLGSGENVWLISPSSDDEVEGLFEVAGEPIHSFLTKSKTRNKRDALSHSFVIVDEAQSVDTLSFYKLLKCLPLSANLCIVGDRRKLPPLGPGNVFQQLLPTGSELITELEHQNDNDVTNGLSRLKASMSHPKDLFNVGSIPNAGFVSIENISIYETSEKSHEALCNITSNIWLSLYQNFSTTYQVICANNPICDRVNEQVQQLRYFRKSTPNLSVDESTFYEGDPVIFNKKNPFLDISAGEAAIVHEIFHEPLIVRGRECLLSISMKGKIIELTEEDITGLSVSYAITANKIQSRQFENSIVVLDNTYLISKAWLYTAIVSTSKSMMVVGKRDELERKNNASEFATHRHFGTPITLAI